MKQPKPSEPITDPRAEDDATHADEGGAEDQGNGGAEPGALDIEAVPSAPGNNDQDVHPDQGEQQPSEGVEQSNLDSDAPFGRRVDGSPMLKRGRPRKSEAAAQETAKQRAKLRSVTQSTHKAKAKFSAAPTITPLTVVNYQAMGETAAGLWFSVGTMAVGPEWQPDVAEGEPQAVAGAFRDYFKAINMRDLPPAFALCVVLTVYTMKRVNKPTVRGKLQLLGAWVKGKIPKRRNVYTANTPGA
jgi:hypothetical protein